MVTIRLTRRGTTNTPFYHVVVTDSRKRQGGPALEMVGFFNPTARKNDVKLKLDLARIDYWLGKGAKLSDRVSDLTKSYRKSAAAAPAEAA
jgi:small subunit ribosomal protein S16